MKGFLDNLSTQTHKDLEIVLDHNEPTDEEINLIEEYNEKYDNIFHIQVDGLDPIGVIVLTLVIIFFHCLKYF